METLLHASAVAFDGRAALLVGPSGSGKSALAVQLVALGGMLVADDRVQCETCSGTLWIMAPDNIADSIEARGLGILRTPTEPARACAVVDLSRVETERLPPLRETTVADVPLPLLYKVESPAFPAMLKLYLSGERLE
ncbi:MAG: serine kinase [Pseudomonadota bacterium]